MVQIDSTKSICQREPFGVDVSVSEYECGYAMCRVPKVVDNTCLSNDPSKMQYKNTSKGAADERLTWSIRPNRPCTVVTKEKKTSSDSFPCSSHSLAGSAVLN